MKIQALLCLLFFKIPSPEISGQDTIRLKNPSFEGEPSHSKAAMGWISCGQIGETCTDLQPGCFGVKMKPTHGNTYLGMVVRDNGSWEMVQQRLSSPLQKDSVYSFSVFLAKSDTLISLSRAVIDSLKLRMERYDVDEKIWKNAHLEVNYGGATVLRIWGGNKECGRKELLAESPPIENPTWTKVLFELKPIEKNHKILILEAFYLPGTTKPYNGNLMVDRCSPIIKIRK